MAQLVEMGSYDPALSAFAPTKYLGTRNNSLCVTGYDQAGFVAGSSSALFNAYNTSVSVIVPSLVYLVEHHLGRGARSIHCRIGGYSS